MHTYTCNLHTEYMERYMSGYPSGVRNGWRSRLSKECYFLYYSFTIIKQSKLGEEKVNITVKK